MINRMKNLYLKGILLLLVVGMALTAFLLTGCAEVNYLRDAQSSFNEAAQLENNVNIALSDNLDSVVSKRDAIRAGYANTIFSIDRLSDKQIESLKTDKLWGLVLTIKALSYWRLGDYDKMGKVKEEAIKGYTDQLYPRDKALLNALDGLRRIDEALVLVYSKTDTMTPEKKQERLHEVDTLLNNAIDTLTSVRASVEHPEVDAYITQAILAAYRNKMTANKVLAGGTYSSTDKNRAIEQVKLLDCSFKKYLSNTELNDVRPKIIEPWKSRLGFPDVTTDCK